MLLLVEMKAHTKAQLVLRRNDLEATMHAPHGEKLSSRRTILLECVENALPLIPIEAFLEWHIHAMTYETRCAQGDRILF